MRTRDRSWILHAAVVFTDPLPESQEAGKGDTGPRHSEQRAQPSEWANTQQLCLKLTLEFFVSCILGFAWFLKNFTAVSWYFMERLCMCVCLSVRWRMLEWQWSCTSCTEKTGRLLSRRDSPGGRLSREGGRWGEGKGVQMEEYRNLRQVKLVY